MKRLSFIFLFALIFLPARAREIIPLDLSSIFQVVSYTAKAEPIKDWWKGGGVRLMSLGNSIGALPDASTVFDIYEGGIASAVFKRERKNVINIFSGIYFNQEFVFNPYKPDLDLIKMWFSDNDFFSFNPSYHRISNESINNYFISFELEYARKLGEDFSAGLRLKYSDLSSIYIFSPDDTVVQRGNDMEWAVDVCWEGSSINLFSNVYSLVNAASVGNMKEIFRYGWPVRDYEMLLDEGASIFTNPEDLSGLPEKQEQSTQGLGVKYMFYLSDLRNKSILSMNIGAGYDWKYHEKGFHSGYYGERWSYRFDGMALYLDMRLKARMTLLDCISMAVTKNILLELYFANNTEDHMHPSVEQPLEIEFAYFNDFIRIIPFSYSDALGAPGGLKLACEANLFGCLDLRIGLNIHGFVSFKQIEVSYGLGVDLGTFLMDIGVGQNDLAMLDLKWVF